MESMWPTIGILLVGIVVVVGGVLALRLHAFLALVLGALIVGMLTPAEWIEAYSIEKNAIKISAVDVDGGNVALKTSQQQGTRDGMMFAVLRAESGSRQFREIGRLRVQRFDHVDDGSGGAAERAIAAPIDFADGISIQINDVVIHPYQQKAAAAVARQTVGERVANGFGNTCAKIGILIAMASIIGKCLLDSGAADRIVRSALKILGEKGAPFAFMSSGFLLAIPVFFDTVFYLMIPLGKAMRMRTGRNYLLYVLTIVAGASMAHSLVPPTPGPLFVAEQLGVDIGAMILAGCIVGIFTSGIGYVYAVIVNRIWELPIRETPDFSFEQLEELAQRDESELPPTGLSLLPIVLPVVLIGGFTVLKSFAGQLPAEVMRVAATLGNKNIALVISAAIAMATLIWQKRTSLRELADSIQAALANGGVIILITAAGGAFGGVLQQTGVSGLIRELPLGSPMIVVTLAFLITAAIRTAQGSATVAMITAVGILSGIATADQLGFHPVYLALAIGCGSKPIAWMNDSGFWVIAKMSGMTEGEALKYVTPMSTLMGLVGLVVVIIGVTLFPLV